MNKSSKKNDKRKTTRANRNMQKKNIWERESDDNGRANQNNNEEKSNMQATW